MRISDLHIDAERLAEICRRYRVMKLEVFGSFATGKAGEGSDLDFLVSFEPQATDGFEFVALQLELEAFFRRPVDIFTRESVEEAQNEYFRNYALANTELIYERAA